jgi:hypothetical protein
MTMVAGMPSMLARQATPCAWLPADAAITPRARSSGVRLASFTAAPRTLNELVY